MEEKKGTNEKLVKALLVVGALTALTLISYKMGYVAHGAKTDLGFDAIFKDNPDFKKQMFDAICNTMKVQHGVEA